MSVIIIPRKHLRQPTGRMMLNANNELAAGLEAFVALYAGAVYTRNRVRPLTISGTAPQIVDHGGLNRDYPSLDGRTYSGFFSVSPEMTIICEAARAGGAVNGRLFDKGTGLNSGVGTTSLSIERPASGGLQYWNVNALPTQPTQVAFTLPPPGSYGATYFDGVEQTRTAGAVGSGNVTQNNAEYIFGNRSAGDRPMYGTIRYGMFFSRLLSLPAINSLRYAPYQVLTEDPIRIYSFPSGPISLTINSITASNITSSGARITLGLTR